jgi:DNA-binding CsgD family transcriptional regulator/PAS domain-containing protein
MTSVDNLTVDAAFVAAVEAIYETAASPSRWPHALQKIADILGDVGTVLMYRRDNGSFGTVVSPSLADAQRDYERHWWTQDIRSFRAIERGILLKDAITDRHLVSQEEVGTHPIYTEFLIPHGLGWIAGSSISPDPRVLVWISVQRMITRPRFTDQELAIVTRVARHAENALRLGIRLLDAEMVSLGLGEALSRINIGVFVLDEEKRVMFTNAAAEKFVGRGLLVTEQRLAAALGPERDVLDTAISSMMRAGPGDLSEPPPRPILVRHRDAKRPLTIYVLPARSSVDAGVRHFLARARAFVLVIGSQHDQPPAPAVVRDLLGLTLGEARVAALVATGRRPAQTAEQLGITEETARTVLKRVFAKVGVSSQSQLAALLAKLVLH